ncbi:hypothetical protein Hanom_Chr09g00764351 [Helianthus anomalus]
MFLETARFEEFDKLIHAVLRKKDQDGKDIDVEFEFGVEDVRRVLDLQDANDDPIIMSERLVKGLWCRMGFTVHLNGKMLKTNFSKAYRYLMPCMVHFLGHLKGAYDEVPDYIMNFIASLVLNKKYNISQVIFEYMKENWKNEADRYIMYPRFIMMLRNDKIKDLSKNRDDIMELRSVNNETIARITKEKDAKTKQMICRIKVKNYVAPENDKWRHEKSDSDNEDNKMSEMVEKKTRWWCVRDGKRKRTPKSSPAVTIPKDGDKGIVKGGALRQLDRSSVAPQQRLVDETVLEPSMVIEQEVNLLSQSFESYLKRNEEVAAQKAQGSNVQDKDQESSSDDDSEATQSESELDPTTLGRGKAQLKKKPLKKKKTSDDEDRSYEPDDSKRKKRKTCSSWCYSKECQGKENCCSFVKRKGRKER